METKLNHYEKKKLLEEIKAKFPDYIIHGI